MSKKSIILIIGTILVSTITFLFIPDNKYIGLANTTPCHYLRSKNGVYELKWKKDFSFRRNNTATIGVSPDNMQSYVFVESYDKSSENNNGIVVYENYKSVILTINSNGKIIKEVITEGSPLNAIDYRIINKYSGNSLLFTGVYKHEHKHFSRIITTKYSPHTGSIENKIYFTKTYNILPQCVNISNNNGYEILSKNIWDSVYYKYIIKNDKVIETNNSMSLNHCFFQNNVAILSGSYEFNNMNVSEIDLQDGLRHLSLQIGIRLIQNDNGVVANIRYPRKGIRKERNIILYEEKSDLSSLTSEPSKINLGYFSIISKRRNNSEEIYVVRSDKDWNIVWSKKISNVLTIDPRLAQLLPTKDGGVIVLCDFNFFSHLIQMDRNGNVVYDYKPSKDMKYEQIISASMTPNGELFTYGTFRNPNTNESVARMRKFDLVQGGE